MRHIDLFSGVGGFALAAQWAWEEEYENIGFCDNNKFCQEVLKLRFPNCKIYGDIRQLSKEQLIADSKTEQSRGSNIAWSESEEPWHIDLLTGGFPCQPFSNAGKQRAQNDDRFLWPEMLRVIAETKPTWIIGENVAGIINLALEQVCAELEAEGYEVWPIVIPACALNAPHRRDRVWIIANRQHERSIQCKSKKQSRSREGLFAGSDCNAPDRNNQGLERMPKTGNIKGGGQTSEQRSGVNLSWNKDWVEVATKFCSVDDGLPVELGEFKLSKGGHRTEQLKAYGNAIVPQVACEIMKGIKALSD